MYSSRGGGGGEGSDADDQGHVTAGRAGETAAALFTDAVQTGRGRVNFDLPSPSIASALST